MFDFDSSYSDFLLRDIRKKRSPKSIVLHHKTCPVCDRKLVNLYYSSQLDEYICKKCLDKLIGGMNNG